MTLAKEFAEQSVELASIENISSVLGDCNFLAGASIKNELVKDFPLVTWLLGTSMAKKMAAINGKNLRLKQKDTDGIWKIKLPGKVWTTPTIQEEDNCCWTSDPLNGCEGKAPLKMVCMQVCEDLYDTLGAGDTPIGVAVEGLNGEGMTSKQLEDELARRSLAFHTAFTISQGTMNATSPLTKKFQGVADVMSNEAIIHLDANKVGFFGAFDTLDCRLAALPGSTSEMVIWVHTQTMENVRRLIKKDIYGNYPNGWNVSGDEYTFRGIPVRGDKTVPYNFASGTGTAWLLDGAVIGAVLATNLIVRDEKYIRRDFTAPNGAACGATCDYFFNMGTVAANDANRLAVVNNIPTSAICRNAIQDLEGLVTPTTIIPGA